MDRFFDLLVLATLFAPVALIVAANIAAYRSPSAGPGLLGAYRPSVPLPAALERTQSRAAHAEPLREAA
jgi:hypothetical protein